MFSRYFTQINTHNLLSTSQSLELITGQKVQLNKAIVGGNAFRHESGIHQQGINVNRDTYEFIKPQDVGSEIIPFSIGKHSGKSGISTRLKELGLDIPSEFLYAIINKIKNRKRIKSISDKELIGIAKQVCPLA